MLLRWHLFQSFMSRRLLCCFPGVLILRMQSKIDVVYHSRKEREREKKSPLLPLADREITRVLFSDQIGKTGRVALSIMHAFCVISRVWLLPITLFVPWALLPKRAPWHEWFVCELLEIDPGTHLISSSLHVNIEILCPQSNMFQKNAVKIWFCEWDNGTHSRWVTHCHSCF